MGFGTFVGGMSLAYQGAQRGAQDRIDRDNEAEDRDFLRTQREQAQKVEDFRNGQRQRVLDEQGRADTLRNTLSRVKPAGTVEESVQPPDTMGPGAPKKKTQDEELRDISKAYRDAGDIERATQLNAAADKIAFGRSTAMFNEFSAGSGGLTLEQTAKGIKDIFDADPVNGGVKEIVTVPGGVKVTIANKDTGQTSTKVFANKQALLDSFHAYYSPETWQKLQGQINAARVKTQEELAKENAKSHVVPEGATLVRPDNSTITNPKVDPKAKNPLQLAQGIFADIAEKSEDKLTTAQRAAGEDHLARLMTENPGLQPAMAARVALKIVQDPNAIQPAIRFQTGRFDNMVKDDLTGEEFAIRRGVGDALSPPKGVKPEDIKAQTGEMLGKLEATFPGAKALYVEAAFDKSGAARARLDSFVKDQLRTALTNSVPAFKTMSAEQQQVVVDRALAAEMPNVQSRLDLVANYGSPPKSGKGASSGRAASGAGGVSGMSEATLKQLAATKGHTSQKAAADELERRRAARAEEDEQGFGMSPSSAAASLGFGA